MGHFYKKEDSGEVIPCHFTSYAKPRYENGKETLRASTVGDLRKWLKNGEKAAPSVTTILDVLDKPALMNWKVDRHLQAAYEHVINTSFANALDSFIKESKLQAELQMDQAPQAGTDFHKLMEDYIKDEMYQGHKDYGLCSSVADLIREETKTDEWDWQPEVNIFSDLGYAGQADLIIHGNETWIIDYKTKEFANKFKPKRMAYDNHAQQLAAYGNEINPNFRAANIFVCLETGELDWHEWKKVGS